VKYFTKSGHFYLLLFLWKIRGRSKKGLNFSGINPYFLKQDEPMVNARKQNGTKKTPACGLCGSGGKGLFCGISKKAAKKLNSRKAVQVFEPGTHLFDEGSPAFAVYCLHEGRVKLYKADRKGERQVIRLLGKGEVVGFRGILADEPYAATAEVIEKTVACIIPRQTFIELIEENHDLAFDLMAKLAEELRISEEQMLSLLHYPVRQRAALLLLSLVEDKLPVRMGKRLEIPPLRRNEMAQIIGTTPESMSRALRDFEKKGAIEVSYSRIYLLNPDILDRIADA
jgi:CRP/FNR family transcriptional regulator